MWTLHIIHVALQLALHQINIYFPQYTLQLVYIITQINSNKQKHNSGRVKKTRIVDCSDAVTQKWRYDDRWYLYKVRAPTI